MRCDVCGGEVKKEKIIFDLWVNDELLIIEDVPAEVCQKCGEQVFTPSVTNQIQKIAKSELRPQRTITAPVISFKEAVLT